MTSGAHATYLFDPLCGWCYGASPMIERLDRQADLMVEYLPTGLFAGDGARPMDVGFAAFAWGNDERIARSTGQPFSDAYRRNVLEAPGGRFDSGPATLALTAVALDAPDRQPQALRAIQAARYVHGRDTTDPTVLAETLHELGLVASAKRLQQPDDALIATCHARIRQGRAAMRRFGASGVPTLIAGTGDARRLVPGSALFGNADALIALIEST